MKRILKSKNIKLNIDSNKSKLDNTKNTSGENSKELSNIIIG
jgi:hypothetical protein